MKITILWFVVYFLLIFFTFSVYTWFDNIQSIDLTQYSCDTIVNDKAYYYPGEGEYKVYWIEFENKSNIPLYFWQWKTQIYKWIDNLDINYNKIFSYDSYWTLLWSWIDLFVFNYKYFCDNNFSIPPNKKVRILTTSEEVWTVDCMYNNKIYRSEFSLWSWNIWLNILSDNVLPWSFVFNIPLIWINKVIQNQENVFSFRVWVLYDEDNNLNTKLDNKLFVYCYNMDILYCGDGIVSTEFGEECDWADPQDDGTCKLNCKKECIISSDDIDGDCILNKIDSCPDIPENINWVEDNDWCPEIEYDDTSWYVENINCNMCPCPVVDYGSSLWNGDFVMASLWSKNWEVFYIWSLPVLFDKFPK